jgi:hypothetical protein
MPMSRAMPRWSRTKRCAASWSPGCATRSARSPRPT